MRPRKLAGYAVLARYSVVVAVVAVVAAGLAVAVSRGHRGGHQARPAPAAARAASVTGSLGSARQLRGTNLSLVPAAGAYLGAYVQPASDSQQGQIAAVRSFERQVGQPIALVHSYVKWTKPFPTAAERHFADSGKILLLTWGGSPDTRAIIAGRDDAMIAARAEAVKRLRRPILLEFRHEMDRPNLQWTIHGPADYIAAWDHIRAIFSAVGATNASWVWCPTGYGFQVGRAQAFYPGNNEVDWVCADVYANAPAQSLTAAATPFLNWARHTGKPIIIGEFAAGGNAGGWPAWLTAAGRLAESDRQIRAMAYFDGDGQDSNGHPFQYSLATHPPATRAFAALLRQPFFRPAVVTDP
jgi:hypothetical protein